MHAVCAPVVARIACPLRCLTGEIRATFWSARYRGTDGPIISEDDPNGMQRQRRAICAHNAGTLLRKLATGSDLGGYAADYRTIFYARVLVIALYRWHAPALMGTELALMRVLHVDGRPLCPAPRWGFARSDAFCYYWGVLMATCDVTRIKETVALLFGQEFARDLALKDDVVPLWPEDDHAGDWSPANYILYERDAVTDAERLALWAALSDGAVPVRRAMSRVFETLWRRRDMEALLSLVAAKRYVYVDAAYEDMLSRMLCVAADPVEFFTNEAVGGAYWPMFHRMLQAREGEPIEQHSFDLTCFHGRVVPWRRMEELGVFALFKPLPLWIHNYSDYDTLVASPDLLEFVRTGVVTIYDHHHAMALALENHAIDFFRAIQANNRLMQRKDLSRGEAYAALHRRPSHTMMTEATALALLDDLGIAWHRADFSSLPTGHS